MKQLPLILMLFTSLLAQQATAINCLRIDPIIAKIEFYQDGKKKKVKNNEVKLEKKPFVIQVTYEAGKESLLLFNVRTDDKNYQLALKEEKIDIYPASAMAEYKFNPDKELYLSDKSYHGWYYDGKDAHRYNTVEQKGNKWICRREVNFINPIETADQKIPIEVFEGEAIYGVFFQDDSVTKEMLDPKILMPVKIVFK